MKLSISNIAWSGESDSEIYTFLKENNISGLEIAPTRIFTENPYEKLLEAKKFSEDLKSHFGLEIASMQSICFGINESIFGEIKDKKVILNYVKKAIDFAQIVGCNNLVFGSPKNRIIGENQEQIAVDFFKELGDYAKLKNTILAIEPNPEIYGTNFLNTTKEAIDFVKNVGSEGLKINFDFGTFIYNQENLKDIENDISMINHVHISEPYLNPILKREEHQSLINILSTNNYDGYVSIEMKKLDKIEDVKDTVLYLKNLY